MASTREKITASVRPPRRKLADAIRVLSMDAVEQAGCGHPGMPMGMADIAEVLWNDFLRHNPANPANQPQPANPNPPATPAQRTGKGELCSRARARTFVCWERSDHPPIHVPSGASSQLWAAESTDYASAAQSVKGGVARPSSRGVSGSSHPPKASSPSSAASVSRRVPSLRNDPPPVQQGDPKKGGHG